MAVPLRWGGRVRAAINVGLQPARPPMATLRTTVLPVLGTAARDLALIGPLDQERAS